MKLVKNLFNVFIFLVVLFLVAAVAIPYFMKDEIVQVIKEETNKALNAKVDFKDVDLSLLRNFPAITLSIDQLTVDGVGEFQNIRLFEASNTELELDFWKVWSNASSIPVEAFTLDNPNLNILVLSNGKANWDIVKPSPAAVEETPVDFLVEMEAYAVNNGKLSYVDKSLNFEMEMEQLNHKGSGDFTASVFDLNTKTNLAALSVTMDGIQYLKKAKTDLDAIINMNINDFIFTLKDNMLTINDLKLNAEGVVDMNDEEYVMDLKLSSPQNSFKNLWSIIPAAYTADYAAAKIDGKMALNASIKGVYNGDKNQYPAFKINTKIDNGSVKYPDLPLGLKAIFADVAVNSPSADFDKMTVRIPKFAFKLGQNPFAGNFNLKNPISNPNVKTSIKGILNLADIQKAIPMEGIQALSGIIDADFFVNATLSQIEKEQYEAVDMRGDMAVSDIIVEQDGLPKVAIQSLKTTFNPKRIEVTDFSAQLGQSDIQANGSIQNVLAYFSPSKTMEGRFVFNSNYFNANEWMPEESATPAQKVGALDLPIDEQNAPSALLVADEMTPEVFDRFDFDLDGKIKKMEYSTYELEDLTFKGSINPQLTQIDHFYSKIGDSDIRAKGSVENMMGYALDNEVLTGNIDLNSNYLNLNQFMTETAATEESAAMEVIPVPENVNLKINSNLKKVRYTNFDIENINGAVVVKDQIAVLKDVKGKILGGKVNFDGAYNTQDMTQPKFDMKTSLAALNFKKAFSTFNTFEMIAPIGKFIDGKFNTTLSINGILGNDMMPDLGSLNLSGFFHTLEGVIDGFPVLNQLSDKLNLGEKVKNIKIKDSKNWIEVKNGFVEVKEFEHKVQDMSFKIKGKHSLTNEMAYNVKAKIPRKLLEKTGIGSSINKGWNFLANEASKKGINLANGEFVNLKIDLNGSMNSPKFKIIPVGADGETSVTDVAKNALEEAKNEVIDSVKTVVEETTNEIKDSINTYVKEETDKIKKQTEEAAKDFLDSLASGGNTSLPKLDSLGFDKVLKDSSLGKELDKAKDKLKDLFGRKKKKKEEGGGE
jgi:hypothetical protein